jgi:hypothetical protein
MDEV